MKLDEKRITAKPSGHLAFFNWNDFLKEVDELLTQAKATYPELNQHLVLQEDGIGAESLRGLAAAANALQSETADTAATHPNNAAGSERSLSFTNEAPVSIVNPANEDCPPADEDVTLAKEVQDVPLASATSTQIAPTLNAEAESASDGIIRPTIKTLASDGWRIIDNEQDWYNVLREKAFAVWADGVCNVLVDLVSPSIHESMQDQSDLRI